MADDGLPNEFDLVVVGTGFPESCIAAAASRIGKTVLHIDPSDHYGGSWASFPLDNLNKCLDDSQNKMIRNGKYRWNVSADGDEQILDMSAGMSTQKLTVEKLKLESRRFNIDLMPRIMYSAGSLVQLLVSSNICRYAEFRAVDNVCTIFKNNILNVPCSRSDVFSTKDLSIIEKRLLMKFLNVCMAYGENKCDDDAVEYRGKTFREYLSAQKVTEKISTCVMQAIAMCNENSSFEEGMNKTIIFLKSLGRYGNTPFLFPMYGCGEIPQCFCRLCAVFGGIYCLQRNINDIKINADTNSVDFLINNKQIRAKHVVYSYGHIPDELRESNISIYGVGNYINCLSRGIFLTGTPLGGEELNSGGGGVNVLRLVSEAREAFVLQLSHFSGTCPKGVFIIHITTPAVSDDPETDLLPFTSQIFMKEDAPVPIYSAFFTITSLARAPNTAPIDTSTPIFCTSAPAYEIDYDATIDNARDIFKRMYGTAEFLPRAPDSEEIIVDGEDPQAIVESSLPEDLREQLRLLEAATEKMEVEDSAPMEE